MQILVYKSCAAPDLLPHVPILFKFQLHEIDVGLQDELTSEDLECDVVCLMYDISDPRTFEYCAKSYKVHFKPFKP